MKSPFRRRLFRLFLLFSVLPAVALAVTGYFLTAEVALSDLDSETSIDNVTVYYHQFLHDCVEQNLDSMLANAEYESGLLDFLFVSSGHGTEVIKGHQSLSASISDKIVQAGMQRGRGFVEADRYLFQYVRKEIDSVTYAYAGVLHDSTYATLLEAVRQETASRSASRRLKPEFVAFVALLFTTVSILTIGAAYYLSSRLSRNLAGPLQALSEASRKIADGDFRQEVLSEGEGEIQTLIDSFNRMAGQLENTTTRLAQTERVAAWRQVARRFAHELKNPLQPLLVSLYRIEKQLGEVEAYESFREPLKAASEEVRHLTNLAERFSHLAKLPPPALEICNLNELILSVTQLYREQLSEREFKTRIPEEDINIQADAAYLREALHNLLQNAIDATDKGGLVEMQLRNEPNRVYISISDDGVGMDAKTLAGARLPYFTTKKAGTGLGLAIVEKSIGELGGQVLVDSAPGRGTTVTISLIKEEN